MIGRIFILLSTANSHGREVCQAQMFNWSMCICGTTTILTGLAVDETILPEAGFLCPTELPFRPSQSTENHDFVLGRLTAISNRHNKQAVAE